ncbi:MAG: DUF192 domain-containing protein [Nitrosopumilus sp.]|nr:DUF192 domain-containing protein [Nitrosopumilus sp.]MDH3793750.1 DUF192 domain-containing protein [Nitrosopumilus sp.]MDH3853804.1 DUF192 domain-containing protein [Nitrosopumilus sp.]
MRNKLLIVIPIIVVTAIGIVVFGGNIISDAADYEIIGVGEQSFYSNTIKLDDALVDVQIADTDVKRNRGLMFEEQIPYDQGMLFIYEESGNYSFWMYNVKFALDIIWFDDKGNESISNRTFPHVLPNQNIVQCMIPEQKHCMFLRQLQGL